MTSKKGIMTADFTESDYDTIIACIKKRQRQYTVGDRVYNELGVIVEKLSESRIATVSS